MPYLAASAERSQFSNDSGLMHPGLWDLRGLSAVKSHEAKLWVCLINYRRQHKRLGFFIRNLLIKNLIQDLRHNPRRLSGSVEQGKYLRRCENTDRYTGNVLPSRACEQLDYMEIYSVVA